jgi:hypothetical protein
MGLIKVTNYYGEAWVPQDIRRRRRYNLETMRRLGTPVVIKHMYNDHDVKLGLARKVESVASAYGQPRHDDPLSFGVGFASVENSPNEWYNTRTGEIVVAAVSPGAGYVAVPLHRGFGPGHLTWVIEPDIAEDEFRLNEAGALIKTQTATAQAPWYPEINDNDLIVNVVIDRHFNVVKTTERYQAKMTSPISMRGHQRQGRREYTEDGGNRFVIGHQFEMTLVPSTDILYSLPIDR